MRRLRRHLTFANVASAIALFVAISGGTAIALSGSNTVFSDDLVNNEVRSADVRNDSLSGGGLTSLDLAPASIGSSEVSNASLTGADINQGSLFNNNSLTGADIDESTLSGVNAARLNGLTQNDFASATMVRATGLVSIDRPDTTRTDSTPLLTAGAFSFTGECELDQNAGIVATQIRITSTASGTNYELDEDGSPVSVRAWSGSSGSLILQRLAYSPSVDTSVRGLMQSFSVIAPNGATFQGQFLLAFNLSGSDDCFYAISGIRE